MFRTLNLKHSLKSIPNPNKREYLLKFTEQTEKFGKRLLWRTFHAKNPGNERKKNTYGFKTQESPPMDDEAKPFLDELFGIIPKIKFGPNTNNFQNELKEDIAKVKKSEEMLVKGDKTDNIYKVPLEEYEAKVLSELTKDYKKVDRSELDELNREAAAICRELDIEERVMKFCESEVFITYKDHKEDFNLRQKVRLINPSMSFIGRISKQILEKANKSIREKTGYRQWTNSSQPVEWFKNIERKKEYTFVKYDVDTFYPDISAELFKRALEHGRKYVEIDKNEEKILWHARRGYAVWKKEVWAKIKGSEFDVAIGSPDGAEVAEFVGLYLLSKVTKILPNSGLYRDDGAGVTIATGPQVSRLEKRLHAAFKEEGLKITTEVNIKKMDFLDFEMCLDTGTVRPWRKPGSKISYINTSSAHPKANIRALPNMIQTRLSELSSSAKEFEEVVEPYVEELKSAGYREVNLEYKEKSKGKRNRKRKIMYFNPPFSPCVQTNITRIFNSLLTKYFKKGTLMGKLFNSNNCKISYSTMPNLKQFISGHNKKILRKNEPKKAEKGCNCRGGVQSCPVEGQCLKQEVIYEVEVVAQQQEDKSYIGSTATTFKERFGNHKSDCKLEHRRHATKLSGYVWELRDKNLQATLNYKIKESAPAYNPVTDKCRLCLVEKLEILLADEKKYINDRSELMAKCRHTNKFILSGIT